jgi:SAM-dependent methyltransferase
MSSPNDNTSPHARAYYDNPAARRRQLSSGPLGGVPFTILGGFYQMTKDRLLRTLVPSIPVLARTPVAPILNVFDFFLKKNHPEWSSLPPASLRMRIGVGNHILRNHEYFIASGKAIVTELHDKGYLNPQSRVLELGCGCGRNAIAISQFLDESGTYTGQDVDREMIAWCQNHLQTNRVSFHHADIFSKVYNPDGKPVAHYEFPAKDGSTTLIFSISVFSHLLYDDALHYIREGARVLSKGGYFHMTLSILDFLRDRLGDRWTFSHKRENCYIESPRYPEAAVAYDLSKLEEMLTANGLTVSEIYNKEIHQQTVIAKKA